MNAFENHDTSDAARKSEEHEKRRRRKSGKDRMPKHGQGLRDIAKKVAEEAERIRKSREKGDA